VPLGTPKGQSLDINALFGEFTRELHKIVEKKSEELILSTFLRSLSIIITFGRKRRLQSLSILAHKSPSDQHSDPHPSPTSYSGISMLPAYRCSNLASISVRYWANLTKVRGVSRVWSSLPGKTTWFPMGTMGAIYTYSNHLTVHQFCWPSIISTISVGCPPFLLAVHKPLHDSSLTHDLLPLRHMLRRYITIVDPCKAFHQRIRCSKTDCDKKKNRLWLFPACTKLELVPYSMEDRTYLFGKSFLRLVFQACRLSKVRTFGYVYCVRIKLLISKMWIITKCCLQPCGTIFTGDGHVVIMKKQMPPVRSIIASKVRGVK
jgi:hypothetical protein